MLTPGLVSISFRTLPVSAVLGLARTAGLQAIEWGGDVHCPHGDEATARTVAAATAAAGLTVAAYGSYYRVGVSEAQGLSFAQVLASAVALGAPAIRVWAGNQGSAETSPTQRTAIISDARRIADLAAAVGIRVLSEWHGGTLTDTSASGVDFLRAVGHPHFATVWQPSVGLSTAAALAELAAALPWVEQLHVFHWHQRERLPLQEGADAWRRYLELAASSGKVRAALLEFVRADEPAQLVRDAASLLDLLAPLDQLAPLAGRKETRV
jgi:3-dehydroshikimate dehydratase